MPIDWKDPESLTRLTAAIIGASQNGKPSNKDIATLFGQGATESAIENRLRKVYVLARQLREGTAPDLGVTSAKSTPKSTPKKRKATNEDVTPAKKAKKNDKADAVSESKVTEDVEEDDKDDVKEKEEDVEEEIEEDA
ncbi:MAG: hypothetical protein M1820_005408 [Bogoriella megaspora]|nr:MAG: hypothetical protein M1820_005408 [Bogoriella megaspora]